MNSLITQLRQHWRLSLSGVILLMALVFVGCLSQGPIRIDGLRFLIVSRLERTIPGAEASLKHLDLVWFHDSNALGLRFDDLLLKDKAGRTVASADQMEAALALDSLIWWHLAPARLTADRFFVALSASPNGRIELGYEARGNPEAFAIERLFYDLTGKETLGRPLSYTREVHLTNGTLAFRQVGTPLDWRAHVTQIDFSKRNRLIRSKIGLDVVTQGRKASLMLDARAQTDLRTAEVQAEIRDLIPSQIFPSAGALKGLSHFRAAINGRGNLKYAARTGIERAFLDISAGKGSYDFGKSAQAFDALRLKAEYVPKTRTVRFTTFRLDSRYIDTDLSGRVFMTPEDLKRDRKMAVHFDFAGPRVTGQLADDFPAQTLTEVHFKGTYTPDLRQLDIESGKALLVDAPLTTKGRLYTDDKGQLGADLTARIDGDFRKEVVFAFWPENLTPITRGDLIRRIKGGTYSNADFVLKAAPGHFRDGNLEKADLRLTFGFRDMGLSVDSRLQDATGLYGTGLLQGTSFDLSLRGGHLVEVPLTGGGVSVPQFHKRRAPRAETHIWLTAQSGAAQLIEAIDPLTGGHLQKEGLTRDRLTGDAETRLDIRFPTFDNLTLKNLDLTFSGKIRNAGLKQAALGWDIVEGDLTVTGDYLANRLEVRGPAKLGPFAGEIGYRTQFEPTMQYIDFTGSFNARQFGGSPTKRVAIRGQLELFNNIGKGRIESDIFNGTVNWDGPEPRPTQVVLSGNMLSDGMKGQGLPIFGRFRPEIPTDIRLRRSGGVWTGEVEAEGFSGDLAYIDSQHPRLVYKANISPERARLLGLGALPYFSETRPLTVNIGLDAESREARIRVGDINSVLDWTDEGDKPPKRTLTTRLTPEQMYALGLPRAWFTPQETLPVFARWEQDVRGIEGDVFIGDQLLTFDLPDSDGASFLFGPPKAWARIGGTVDRAFLGRLGYVSHSLELDGKVGFELNLYQTENRTLGALSAAQISAAVLDIDATPTRLQLARSDWVKPVGEAARLSISFDERSGGGLDMPRIRATGERLEVEGKVSVKESGEVDYVDFSELYLRDFADLTARLSPADASGVQTLTLRGKRLDVRPWFNPPRTQPTVTDARPVTAAELPRAPATTAGTAPHLDRPVRLLVDISAVRTSQDGVFSEVELKAAWDGRNVIAGEGSALTRLGSLVTLDFKPQNDYTAFTFEADDLGDLVATALGDKRLSGGDAVIEGIYRNGQIDATLKGEDIRVKQIPALGQVLTLASLRGLSDTLSGAGIKFDDYELPIRYRDNYLFIRNGWAKGDALRINVWGAQDFSQQTMDYHGTLIPAYGVNAAFAGIPLVGDALTSNRGEGVLGLKYRLKGRFGTPQAEINPFSLVLPGFLRRILDEKHEDPLPPVDVTSPRDS